MMKLWVLNAQEHSQPLVFVENELYETMLLFVTTIEMAIHRLDQMAPSYSMAFTAQLRSLPLNQAILHVPSCSRVTLEEPNYQFRSIPKST